MHAKLYSSASALPGLRNIDTPVKVRLFMGDRMRFMFACSQYEMNPESGALYDLNFVTTEEGRHLSLIDCQFGSTPFSDSFLHHGLNDFLGSLPIRPATVNQGFGLAQLGLEPQLHAEINDIPAFYRNAEPILAVFHEPSNLGGMEGEEQPEELEGKPGENPAIDVTLDAKYSLAAMDLNNEGHELLYYSRQDQKLHTLEGQGNYFPALTYEVENLLGMPKVVPEVLDRARSYHEHGVPEQHQWLGAAQPIDILTPWALQLNKTYTARLIAPVFAGTLFGEEVTFTLEEDALGGRRLFVKLPTEETQEIEDLNFPDWTHAFLAVTGEGAEELTALNFPLRDYLSLQTAM